MRFMVVSVRAWKIGCGDIVDVVISLILDVKFYISYFIVEFYS